MFLLCALILCLPFAVEAAAKEKPKPASRPGVKTPGVQISFANLVPEASIDLQRTPEWLGFANFLFAPGPDSVYKIDPKTNKSVEPVTNLKRPCGGMTSAFGSLWIPQCGGGAVARIDPKTFKVTATIDSGVSHSQGIIAASTDSIWMLTDDKTTLSRIDPDQNTIAGEIRLPQGCQSLIFAEQSIWIACPSKNKVLRINPLTNVLEKSIDVSAQPIAVAAGAAGAIWVLCRKEGKVERIDTKTDKVAKTIDLNVPDVDGFLGFGAGSLWVTQTGFPLTRIDTTAETVVQQFHGVGGGGALLLTKDALWLATSTGAARIDPKRVLATIASE